MKKLRVACVCNINHTQYILARYLRDMGHDVTLFLMEEFPHFYPEYDTYGPVENIKVVELPWKHKELYKISKREILKQLGGFDFYCGSEFAPAFFFKAGIQMNIYNPIGTDLIDYPFAKPKGFIPDTWAIDEYQFNLYQKAGIRTAGAIFMNKGGDVNLERALTRIKFKGERIPYSLPYLYLPQYQSPQAVSRLDAEIKALRERYELLLISHGRCEFLDKESVHYKGTEIMLEGIARYIKAGNKNICLVMLEYGNDWEAARKMALELGIGDNIHWLPKCGRKEIIPILKYFDAGFGTLSFPHWSYSVAMELISAGVTVLKRKFRGPLSERLEYPAISINSEEEIAKFLYDLRTSEGKHHKEIGHNALLWFQGRVFCVIEILGGMIKNLNTPKPNRFLFRNMVYLIWGWNTTILRILSKLGLQITLLVRPR